MKIIALAYIYQLAKFGDLMGCGSKDTFNNPPRDFEILGWCPAEPVLPHGEKVAL